jgi:hypothetical protein
MGWSGWIPYLEDTVRDSKRLTGDYGYVGGGQWEVQTDWEVEVPYFGKPQGKAQTDHNGGFTDTIGYSLVSVDVEGSGHGKMKVEVDFADDPQRFTASW